MDPFTVGAILGGAVGAVVASVLGKSNTVASAGYPAWSPPDPPSDPTADPVITIDPRVNTTHQIGVLPCPGNPPPPVGWTYWTGAVSPGLTAFATSLLHDSTTYPMGSFVQAYVDGEVVGARIEWHTLQGATNTTGCFRGCNLMRAIAAPSPAA